MHWQRINRVTRHTLRFSACALLLRQVVDVIGALPEEYKDKLAPFLKAKPIRTASGIAVVVRLFVCHLPPPRNKHRLLHAVTLCVCLFIPRLSCASHTVAHTLP